MSRYRHIRAAMGALILLCFVSGPYAATGTLSPSPYQLVLSPTTGLPVNGACVWTYLAGTSTPVTTWTDKAMSVANSNPIIATVGRYTAFLQPGISYKYVIETACTPPAHGSVIVSQDNIDATPSSASALDTLGTAGESITAGQAVYLSAGDGGKTAGLWYKADTGASYSSTLYEVGIAPSAIASLGTGTIRLAGQVTGLSSLTVGARYFAGAAGALTSTAPATNARLLGQADSTTSLIVGNVPIPIVDNAINGFRLTLTTALPVTTADVTGASAVTIFCTPYTGNRIALYDSGGYASVFTSAEFSIAVPATTNTVYDVYAYNNAGVPALELLAWTNDTTRATAIARTTTGALTKSGDLSRRFLGSFRTTAVSGQTEDSLTNRYFINYYNRVDRNLQRLETATSWTYNSATIHEANASTSNEVNILIALSEDPLEASIEASWTNVTSSNAPIVGIGIDSYTAFAANQSLATAFQVGNSGGFSHSRYRGYPGLGKHRISWNEAVVNSGTAVTFVSNTNSIGGLTTGSSLQSGLIGSIKG